MSSFSFVHSRVHQEELEEELVFSVFYNQQMLEVLLEDAANGKVTARTRLMAHQNPRQAALIAQLKQTINIWENDKGINVVQDPRAACHVQ